MLRHAIIQDGRCGSCLSAIWCSTSSSAEMMVNSDKTIDARGRAVVIQNGPCLRLERVTNVIVESVIFRNCTMRTGTIKVRSGKGLEVKDWRDGNAVEVWGSTKVWIDHCGFEKALDTQVNIVVGSTDVAVTNNYFVNQDEVMLMSNNDAATTDDNMRVTVALNRLWPELQPADAAGETRAVPRARTTTTRTAGASTPSAAPLARASAARGTTSWRGASRR
ncbi:hypothetical protein CLOM_g13059 [Closterium sp. NIES-68]|nr:hypothetical protein CLOM_g13059 [Closterium sp. NIES-68]